MRHGISVTSHPGLPADVGAAVVIGVSKPWIAVRADLQADLRTAL